MLMAVRGRVRLTESEFRSHFDEHLRAHFEELRVLAGVMQPADHVVSAVADDPVPTLRQVVWAAKYTAFD